MDPAEALELARIGHGLIMRTLVLKAGKLTDPGFSVPVRGLASFLSAGFRGAAGPIAEDALTRLVDLVDRGATPEEVSAALTPDLRARLAEIAPGEAAAAGPVLSKVLSAVYALGKVEGSIAKPAGGIAGAFDVADQAALAGLKRVGLVWIGQSYGDGAFDLEGLSKRVEEALKNGQGREETGRQLKALLGDQFDRSDSYWMGLSATVATRARSFGALEGLRSSGVHRYTYVNPMDERTSEICRHMDGKTFEIRDALNQRDQLLEAQTPDDWKRIAPWPRASDWHDAAGDPIPVHALAARGILMPPLHFHCRSSIQISVLDFDAPLPELPIDGEAPVEEPAAIERLPKIPRPLRSPKPPKVPTPAEEFKARLLELETAENEARALGLDPHTYALNAGTTPTHRRRLVSSIASELPGPRKTEGEAKIAALDKVTAAYNAAVRHPGASPKWLAKEHARWADAMFDDLRNPAGQPYPLNQWERKNWRERWRTHTTALGPDYLRLFRSEGETVRLNDREPRGAAHPGAPGFISFGSERLRSTYGFGGEGHKTQVFSHEIHHRCDAILGGGEVGSPWLSRPGWEHAPATWSTLFGEPFDRVKTRKPISLGGDGWAWGGDWVTAYEGRIYGFAQGKPTETEYSFGAHISGPIEFIAQATSYRDHALHTLQNARDGIDPKDPRRVTLTFRNQAGDIAFNGSLPRKYLLASMINQEVIYPERSSAVLAQARRVYGDAYIDQWEAGHRDGERGAYLMAKRLTFASDRDLAGTAYLWSRRTGVSVDKLIGGKDSAWFGHATGDEASLRALLQTIPAAPAGETEFEERARLATWLLAEGT